MTALPVFITEGQVRVNFEDPQLNALGAPVDTFGNGYIAKTNKGLAMWAQVGTGGVSEGNACLLQLVTGVWTATALTTTIITAATPNTSIGITQMTNTASVAAGNYLWFFMGPFSDCQALVANGVAINVQLTSTATAGVLGTGGTNIQGLSTNVANASGAAALTSCRAGRELGTQIT